MLLKMKIFLIEIYFKALQTYKEITIIANL